MQAIRKIVPRESIKAVTVPEEFGDQVEIIVLPLQKTKKISAHSQSLMKLQEKCGFVSEVLADKREDVWNEL